MEGIIKTRSELQSVIDYELKKYNKHNGLMLFVRRMIPISEKDIIIKHQIRLRKTEYYINSGKRFRSLVSRLFLNRIQNKYCLHIPVNTVAEGMKLTHIGPILINWHAKIGRDSTIAHGKMILPSFGKEFFPPTVSRIFRPQ